MKKVLLTPKQFDGIASNDMDCVHILKSYKTIIDFTPSPNSDEVKRSPSFYYGKVYEAIELMFEGLQGVIKTLEGNASILYSVADRAGLEALGVVIKSEQTEKATIAALLLENDKTEEIKALK